MLTLIFMLGLTNSAVAQTCYPGVGQNGDPGGFSTDGNLLANSPNYAPYNNASDWANGLAGTGIGVFLNNGTPKDVIHTAHAIDLTGNTDQNVFKTGSNKVSDNPNTYNHVPGSTPPKDDIGNGYIHVFRGPGDSLWVAVGGDRRATNGDSYIDFEFLQNKLVANDNGTFTSTGPDGGRTVGDFIVTIHLTKGGKQADAYFQGWQSVGPGLFSYVDIIPPASAFCAANVDSAVYVPWGAFGSNFYQVNAFGEALVNLTALNHGLDPCIAYTTVFIRTKSSQSATAELKDFITPFNFEICNDFTPPQIMFCPNDTTINCTDQPVFGKPLFQDNCYAYAIDSLLDKIVPGVCPQEYSITRAWWAIDICGNVSDTCSQTIYVEDNTAPLIFCAKDKTIDCAEAVIFDEPTVKDDCDPFPRIEILPNGPIVIAGDCPQESIYTRTWRATDACGNVSNTCSQTITKQDTTKPMVTCPPNKTFECDEIGDFGTATAEDNCDPNPVVRLVSRDSIPGPCPQNYQIVLKYVAEDACGNVSDTCPQTITVIDTTAPQVVFCPKDDTVDCRQPQFGEPEFADNCDPNLMITHKDTLMADYPKLGDTTYTRTWTATDHCGNVSGTCSQTITVLPCLKFCTFTQGGWGSECPDSQKDNPLSTQPGCVCEHYFSQVFPNGVKIGDPAGPAGGPPKWYSAYWTTSNAVKDFLPNGSTPGVLNRDYTNPTTTSAGVSASQLLALRLNREYICKGVFTLLGLSPDGFCYGNFKIPASCGKFAGLTVDEFLAVADSAVGGKVNILRNYGNATLSDVNQTATCLNQYFDGCDPFAPQLVPPKEAVVSEEPLEKEEVVIALPEQFSVGQNYPNPFNASATISYALPTSGKVTITIYNVLGQKVIILLDEEKPVGYHSVVWDGRDSQGNVVSTGVYFYGVAFGNQIQVKRMTLIK